MPITPIGVYPSTVISLVILTYEEISVDGLAPTVKGTLYETVINLLFKLLFRTLLTIIFYLTFVYFYIIIYLSKEKEYSNMKEQIKSRILVEMQSVLNREQLQELKLCLDRNLYNVAVESECNELMVNHYPSNEEMIKRYYADLVISGKSDKTIEQYMNQIGVFFSMVNKNWHEVNKDDIVFFLGSLLKNGKIKKVSIDNKRRRVKTFFNFLEDND